MPNTVFRIVIQHHSLQQLRKWMLHKNKNKLARVAPATVPGYLSVLNVRRMVERKSGDVLLQTFSKSKMFDLLPFSFLLS